ALLDAAHYADYASPDEYRKVHPLNLSWRMLAHRDQVNASGYEYIGLYRIGVGATIELLPLCQRRFQPDPLGGDWKLTHPKEPNLPIRLAASSPPVAAEALRRARRASFPAGGSFHPGC